MSALTYRVESARHVFDAASAEDAIAHTCTWLLPDASAYISCGPDVLAECYCKGAGRYVWTLAPDSDLWRAWRKLPCGHTYTDESIRPESDFPNGGAS